MIPKNVREGAVAQNLVGETVGFTISANGKAFRTLIDSLYSNKVKAVIRELSSNAFDSHTEAGQKRPFKVSIPTSLDPTFRVRDFGVGLSHEQVMGLYTRIFESTKEATNEQTGQLGLGSKSPFAYTDSFSVVAYSGVEKRVYVAFLATDGVPSITHVNTMPSTEPRGVEVMFAAKREDIRSFQREMQFVAMGYPVNPPEVEGMEVRMPEPRLKGNGWAIYPNGVFGDLPNHHFIRQGSVIYPTDQRFPHVGGGWITIVDIPIGTAEVTASREALSMDDDTRRALTTIRDRAYRELHEQVNTLLRNAKTRIDKAMVFSEYNGVLDNLRGSTTVSLVKDENQGHKYYGSGNLLPGEILERAAAFGKHANARGYGGQRRVTGLDYSQLATMRLLVNDAETKLVRRNKRVNEFALRAPNTWVLDVDAKDRKKAVAWITECFALKAEQIKMVSTLPDCPPPKKAPSVAVKRVLKPGQYWMPRWEGRVQSTLFGQSDRANHHWPDKMIAASRTTGIALKWDETFWVTAKQQEAFEKKGLLPESMRLDVVLKAALDTMVAKAPLDEAQTLVALHRMVGEWNKALPVVLDNFFPNLNIDNRRATEVIRLAEIAGVDLRTRPIVAKLDAELAELATRFPLLFQKSDRKHYESYVEAVKALATASK